jgi:hypothetical protein
LGHGSLPTNLQSTVQCFASWLSMCKVEMESIVEISIVAMNVNYYNVYSVFRVQLCTWTTNLQRHYSTACFSTSPKPQFILELLFWVCRLVEGAKAEFTQ